MEILGRWVGEKEVFALDFPLYIFFFSLYYFSFLGFRNSIYCSTMEIFAAIYMYIIYMKNYSIVIFLF